MTTDSVREGSDSPGHILIVDDDIDVRTLARRILERRGHEVTACEDGVAAMEYYRVAHEEIDLVLLDLIMPKVHGRDVVTALREINPAARTLICTGFVTPVQRERLCQTPGVVGIIDKPYSGKDLLETVRAALQEVDTEQ